MVCISCGMFWGRHTNGCESFRGAYPNERYNWPDKERSWSEAWNELKGRRYGWR